MKLWLDTEFNKFRGELISMALVAENGYEWYQAVPCLNPGDWVKQHVIPVLHTQPLPSVAHLTASLARFLAGFDRVHVVADWPEDIAHLCNALITGPGQRIDTPPMTFEIRRDLTSLESAVPHNALHDARALMDMAQRHDDWLKRNR